MLVFLLYMVVLRVFGFSFLCILLVAAEAMAQVDSLRLKSYTADVKDFTINNAEDKISVTSQTPLLLRDAPGTVTVVSEDDIQRAGARDLMDVIRLIPGFDFYMDVQGVVGIASRGNSANEATLILVDGIEMNELLYGSNQFGNHFPIDQIRRIEVIRGPGSVIYGGFAVYAVINILTKSSESVHGVRVGQTMGETKNGTAQRTFSSSFGVKTNRFTLGATAGLGEGIRSDKTYSDLNGNSYNMLENSPITSKLLAVHFNTGNLFVKGLVDIYHTRNRDNQTEISTKAYPLNFSQYHIDIRYVFKPGANLTITPLFNFRMQNPWETPPGVDSLDQDKVIVFKTMVSRTLLGLNATWKAAPNLDFLFSGQTMHDHSHDYMASDSASPTADYYCETLLTQAIWKTRVANFTFGARFDYHSYYQPIISPRIAATRSFGRWHVKGSFNRSFRTPALANISLSLGEPIKPQLTNYLEAEIGYATSKSLQVNLNYYHIEVKNGIVYSVLPDGFTEGYSNAAHSGTQGVEAEIRLNHSWLFLQTGYSFYTTKGMTRYDAYKVDCAPLNLALPAHKLTLQANVVLSKKVRLNHTFFWYSDRYGFNGNEAEPGTINYGRTFQWNCFLQVKDVYLKGLSVGAGVFDITNSRYSYIQSYNSGHMPLPGMSREFVLKIVYGINLSK